MRKVILTKQKISLPDFTMDKYDFAEIIGETKDCYKIRYNDEISFISKSKEGYQYTIHLSE